MFLVEGKVAAAEAIATRTAARTNREDLMVYIALRMWCGSVWGYSCVVGIVVLWWKEVKLGTCV